MKLPRRQFLQLTGAAIAVPAVGRISPVEAEPAARQVETLSIKREEVQQTAKQLKGAFFGESNDDQADLAERSIIAVAPRAANRVTLPGN